MPKTPEPSSRSSIARCGIQSTDAPGLVNAVAARLEALLRAKAAGLGMTIHALEIMPDHVHLCIESDPRWSLAEIVNRMKGSTSHTLRQEFPHLRSRLPTL